MDKMLIVIIKNDWAALITEEVPTARIRKKSFLVHLKTIIVTFIPLTIYFCIKQFCPIKTVNENYLPLLLLFSIIWTALNLLLWLDPEIASKLNAVKTARSLLDRGGTEE